MQSKKSLALERVIENACNAILNNKFHSVSVSEIAHASRCSTATIYEIYGSKDNLFTDALGKLLHDWAAPEPKTDSEDSFESLFDYMRERLFYFEHPTTRRLLAAIHDGESRGGHISRWLMDQRSSFRQLVSLIEDTIRSGDLVMMDSDSIGYIMMASSSYESVMAGIIMGTEAKVDHIEILRKSFTPLVTCQGAARLNILLRTLPEVEIEDRLPLSMQHCMPPYARKMALREKLFDLGIPSPHLTH